MVNNISFNEREYALKISEMRYAGNFEKAVNICDEAIKLYEDNNFFYKIKGDILFKMKDYDKAVDVYMDYLEKIKNNPEFFTNFSRFIEKVDSVYEIKKSVFDKLLKISRNENYAEVIRKGALRIIYDYWPASNEVLEYIKKVNAEFTVEAIEKAIQSLKLKDKCDIIYFLNKISVENCIKSNNVVNRHILKLAETFQMYDCALLWVKGMLKYRNDGVAIRSLFRICRLRNDYSDAQAYMEEYDVTKRVDFNIQYELVLFYDAQGDEIARNATLADIDRIYDNSIPIAQTLFKFYIKYDMPDKARLIEKRINDLRKVTTFDEKKQKDFEKQNRENQEMLLMRLTDLLEEQEHNRRLLAITDLIKGFSHELGQPITNIRYAIQLFYMRQEKEQTTINLEEKALLDGIIVQTSRVGKLLDRFAPIVSSKNKKEYFKVYHEIVTIFEELNMRLSNEGIEYTITGDENVELYGEAIQFSQVFYNLIINSIYAINKKGVRGKIDVSIQVEEDALIICFVDNGTGISGESMKKIFDPFYSTKRKESEEGGEGLGLYIVWNILKIFNGRIYADPAYMGGAKFVIRIKLEENRNV